MARARGFIIYYQVWSSYLRISRYSSLELSHNLNTRRSSISALALNLSAKETSCPQQSGLKVLCASLCFVHVHRPARTLPLGVLILTSRGCRTATFPLEVYMSHPPDVGVGASNLLALPAHGLPWMPWTKGSPVRGSTLVSYWAFHNAEDVCRF